LDEEVTIPGTFYYSTYRRHDSWQCKTTWRNIFKYISPYLVEFPGDLTVKTILSNALGAEKNIPDTQRNIDDQFFRTIGIQLKALGLVKIDYQSTVGGGMGLFWSATPAGERLMLQIRTVRTALPKGAATVAGPK
jgi:hypothetical protein